MDNFAEELEEFLKIMDNNDVDQEEFLKYLEFEHEDCAISTRARNYSTHVSFIIELTNYLTEVEFSYPTKSLRCSGFSLRSSATYHPKRS
jgi:hypothetical protein